MIEIRKKDRGAMVNTRNLGRDIYCGSTIALLGKGYKLVRVVFWVDLLNNHTLSCIVGYSVLLIDTQLC